MAILKRPGPKKGTRPSGRQKGTKDKAVVERERVLADFTQKAMEKLGPELMLMTAVEVMEFAMRVALEAGWVFKAAELASDVAPYRQPKLTSMTQSSTNPDATRSDEDLQQELDEIRARQTASTREGVVASSVQDEPAELEHSGALSGGVSTGSTPRPPVH